MQSWPYNIRLLLRRLLLILFIYTSGRLLFFLYNYNVFHEIPPRLILSDFVIGIRFDIVAILITNAAFIFLHLLPFSFFYSRGYQLILKTLFVMVNSVAILLNCIDFIYFKFSGRRSSSELLEVMSFGKDFINTVPRMLVDFWHATLICFLLIFLMIKLYKATGKISPEKKKQNIPMLLVQYIFLIALFFIGTRGGLQLKPLKIISAASFASTAKETSLILNTPFTVIKSIGSNTLEEEKFFPQEEAEKISPVIKKYSSTRKNLNVVLVILEGIGKEYIGSLNHSKGYTPFLDSLIGEGLVCTSAFANDKSSIEGIPAITAGIPVMMPEPYITSVYYGNDVSSLAHLLGSMNYSTAFFHGGTNGTMGFDGFATFAGYQKYFGRNEYGNDKDYDGDWGIFDEPFMEFSAGEISEMPQPFFATVFTLSSHHPYHVPKKYAGIFRKGSLPIHESVQYADYSLRKFFERCSKTTWFDSTLFVITADHTSLSEYPYYQTRPGLYSVPIIFYQHHSDLKGTYPLICQSADIIPSVMDYLGYSRPFFSFGNSIFDMQSDRFSVSYMDETYQLIYRDYVLLFNGEESISLFSLNDSLMRDNLVAKNMAVKSALEQKIKSLIQVFNHVMIHNKMKVD